MLIRTLNVKLECRMVKPHWWYHIHRTAKLDKALMTNTYISCRQNHSPVYLEGLAVVHFVGCVKQLLKFTFR